MQNDQNKPLLKEPPEDEESPKPIQAAESDAESLDAKAGSLSKLRKASEDLKTKIADAKRRNNMPLDSALGKPEWEQNAADGHLDVPDEDDK
jgi:hypothetical protein